MAKKLTGLLLTMILAAPATLLAASGGSSPQDSARCFLLIREAMVYAGQLDDLKKAERSADFIHKAQSAKSALKYGECVDNAMKAKDVK